MLMCRFSEVHPTRLESINVGCNKVGEHVWPCILKMNMKNSQWKHILIVSNLTTLLSIGLPSDVSSIRLA
jgi:uncharacterized protein (DUF983 family)